ncbi:MAG: SDR family NAD(P)-dependent oxidoreductase [Rhizobiaceae bacterium]
MDFRNRKVLVTGGSRGIGRALTQRLVESGAEVVIIGRNSEALEKATDEYPSGKVVGLQVDLSKYKEIDRLISEVSKDHSDISVLINNAGLQIETDFIKGNIKKNITASQQEIAINISAPIALTAGLLPQISKHQSAAIVNITTGLAISPKQTAPTYCATKAGLRSFSKSLRYQCEENAPQILVSEVIMSLVDTDMTKGRGSGKISPARAANEIIAGLIKNQTEIWVGKTKLLRIINRLAPSIAARILR